VSVSLFVRLNRPLTIAAIETAVMTALREVLNLDFQQRVHAEFDETDAGGESSVSLDVKSKRVLVAMDGHEERVQIMPLVVPGWRADDAEIEDETLLSVTWHFMRTPLCWALCAAVAIGVAREQQADIQDNSTWFTDVNDQGPDQFCCALRPDTACSDILLAADCLYVKMPKSRAVMELMKGLGLQG